jgi:hypothetical protein
MHWVLAFSPNANRSLAKVWKSLGEILEGCKAILRIFPASDRPNVSIFSKAAVGLFGLTCPHGLCDSLEYGVIHRFVHSVFPSLYELQRTQCAKVWIAVAAD